MSAGTVSYKKKLWKKIIFCILKVTEEKSRIQSLVRIRTKMSRIPNIVLLVGNRIVRQYSTSSIEPGFIISHEILTSLMHLYIDTGINLFWQINRIWDLPKGFSVAEDIAWNLGSWSRAGGRAALSTRFLRYNSCILNFFLSYKRGLNYCRVDYNGKVASLRKNIFV